jgi:hypothetical protein
MPSNFRATLLISSALLTITPLARAADTIREFDSDQAPPATQPTSLFTPAPPIAPPQPAQPKAQPPAANPKPNLFKPAPLDNLKPGQQVSALINNQWTDVTFLEKDGDSYSVSEVWPNWPDEIYPYSAVLHEGSKTPDPETFKPAMAVQVYWGNRYWPARVLSANPSNIIIRWDHSNEQTHKLTANQIRTLPNQPVPRPGRIDKPDHNQRPQIQPRPQPVPDKFDMI